MYLHGEFINHNGDTIAVHIVTQGSKTTEKIIGENGESDFFFSSDEAITISSEVNDTFDHLLTQSVTINLQAKYYEESLYGSTCRDGVVNILRNGKVVFAGYIEPLSYSQGFNETYDDVSLSCIDCLSALQYSNYKDIGALGVNYANVRKTAEQRTFLDIVKELLGNVSDGIDILGGAAVLPIYYDGSKSMSNVPDSRWEIFSKVSISELLFLGNSEDDVWTQEEVMTELMRYLNLHIIQDGLKFYVFAWETVRAGKTCFSWNDILGIANIETCRPVAHDIITSIVADCDTQITLDESYNQLLLTDSLTQVENMVESPLDEDSLSYAFDGMQKYMTELSSEGEGVTAFNAFKALVRGESTSYKSASITDWFVQVKRCTNWTFHYDGTKDVSEYWEDGKNQHQLLVDMGKKFGTAAVLSLGKVQKDNGGNDNSPISSVSMTNYLAISVNGNGEDDETKCYPNPDVIKAAIPCAVYNGNTAGGNFSPNDTDTINYIVISGNLVLNPLMPMTGNYTNLVDAIGNKGDSGAFSDAVLYWHKTVADKNDVRYYTRKNWKAESWRDEPTINSVPDNENNPCLIPYTGEGPQQYSFDYSAVGDSTDQLSKVAVLACMLIIGDKCVVEKKPGETLGTDVAGTGNGQLSDFVWQKYKTRSECSSDDEYYQQSFTIGFNPKIGDKLIGSEFKMQNNLNYTDGVDEEGIAVPIRKSDKVSGAVQFMILGPVNTVWDNITRRHPSFWRHTSWSSSSVPLLAHTSCILVKELEVKVVSDNGKMGSGLDDQDIVYMSDTKETFVNKKDDLEFKITTALTSDECRQLGVKNSVSLSTPTNVDEDEGLRSIYDWNTQEQAKPEQIYVDAYWQEWHEPRVVMKQNLTDIGSTVSFFDHYRHPAIGKTFYVQGIDRNLTEGTANITMKEIFSN